MLFRNEEASLQLDIVNYEFPDAAPGSEDSQWLVLRATWRTEDGNVVKDSNSCLQTFELQSMTAGLKVVKAGIRALENGTFEAAVSFYLPNTMDGDDTAELTCSLTIEELGALIDELDRLCAKFPERS